MTESTNPDITLNSTPASAGRVETRRRRVRWSLRTLLVAATLIALVAGNSITMVRLRDAREELSQLRLEVGSLHQIPEGQLAAVRLRADLPLTYQFRVRTPQPTIDSTKDSAANLARWNAPTPPRSNYRLAYSTVLPRGRTQPDWYSAIAVPPGESIVTIRIAEDPRDELWKISTLVQTATSTRRMGTVLPDDHTRIFRTSHDVISTGVARQSVSTVAEGSIRLLDERWLVGEQALLLYGDKPPDEDQVGVYAELQSANAPLR